MYLELAEVAELFAIIKFILQFSIIMIVLIIILIIHIVHCKITVTCIHFIHSYSFNGQVYKMYAQRERERDVHKR